MSINLAVFYCIFQLLVISPPVHLYFSVWSLSFLNISPYSRSFNDCISLNGRLCTFSITIISCTIYRWCISDLVALVLMPYIMISKFLYLGMVRTEYWFSIFCNKFRKFVLRCYIYMAILFIFIILYSRIWRPFKKIV